MKNVAIVVVGLALLMSLVAAGYIAYNHVWELLARVVIAAAISAVILVILIYQPKIRLPR